MSKFALLFLLVYASGILSAVVIGPIWGFYLYELVYFLNPDNRWWGNGIPRIGYSFYAALVMLIMFVVKHKEHENKLNEMPEAKWFVALLLCYGVATIFAANPEMNSRYMGYLINTYVIMFMAYRMLDSERKLELALIFFMIGAAYIGYEAMNVGRDEFGRVEDIGTVDSPRANTIAASLVPVVPLLAYFAWQGRIWLKLLTAMSAALIVNGLVLINSRGAFLGAAIGFAYFIGGLVFSKYKLPKQRAVVVVLIVASLALSVRMIDNTFVERMATIETQASAESEGSGGRRINFWIATFDLLDDHPFGTGIYGYETLSPLYLDPELLGTANGRAARAVHSIWFQSLSEVGWLGFMAFVLLLGSLYRHSRRAKRILVRNLQYRQYYLILALEGGMIGFLASSSFINMFRSEILYWMLLFGISTCAVMIRNFEKPKMDRSP